MISMSTKVQRYLEFRRGLGYQLRTEGMLLEQFGAFADAAGHRGPLTTDLALRWAQLPVDCDRLYAARRLEIVRCFARHLVVTEPGTEVPLRGLLGPAHRRTSPYIYSEAEIAALLAAAKQLAPTSGLKPQTYATLLGLLACTGLRISEALHLGRVDADLGSGVLTIRRTKFRKTRLVPMHPSTTSALQAYASIREQLAAQTEGDCFFVSDSGQALHYSTVRGVFSKLCDSLNITGTGRRRPRLHDLRHTFACRRIEQCYDSHADVDQAVSALSIYLGHAKVSDTYWYVTATPDLLARAAQRFEAFAAPAIRETQS